MTEALNGYGTEALHQTLWRLEQRWLPPTPDATVHHAYEALPPAIFLPPLLTLGPGDGRTFLDVGCGIGRCLALAACLGWNVSGIDRHQPYLVSASDLVPEALLTHADAFDVQSFDADVVYLYRPMVSADNEADLERHVIERMIPGAILFLGTTDPPVELEAAGDRLWRI